MGRRTNQQQVAQQEVLSPVHDLAKEVVSLLGHRNYTHTCLRVSVLDKLITQILTRGLFDAARVVTMMRNQRASDIETVNLYIPEAARRLGKMWSEDIIGFAEVSIGTARLQTLVREISSHWPLDAGMSDPRDTRLLVATPDREDHTLGAITLCTLLRRQGHNVDLCIGATPQSILTELKHLRHDAVMISVSRPEALDSLTSLFKDIRQHMDYDPVLVVGGIVLDHATGIKDQTGADLATGDINQVLKLASSRRKGRISVVQ